MSDLEVYAGAAVVGAVAGLRSMSAPALVSRFAHSGSLPVALRPLQFLNSAIGSRTILGLAAGELIADKLPFIPKRTSVLPLTGRAITGALSGAAICSARKRNWFAGALLGAAAAIGATYGAYSLRKKIVNRYNVPDFLVALAEDGLAAGASTLVLSNLKIENTGMRTALGMGD